MGTRPEYSAEQQTFMLLLTAVWTFAGAVLYLWLPLTAPALLPLCAVAPFAWYVAAHRRLPMHEPSAVLVGLALAGVYLLINASWSLSPETAYYVVAYYFVVLASLHLTLNLLDDIDPAALRAMSLGFYLALVVGGVVICFEAFSQQWGRRLLMTYVPALRTDPRQIVFDGNLVRSLPPFLMNRSMAAMTLLFWPAVLLVILHSASSRTRTWLLLGLLPVVAAVFRSEHGTSKIALVGSAAVFGAFHLASTVVKRTLAWGWIAAVVLVVPLATLGYHSQLYLASWLPKSAQHRIVIWGYTSHQIANAPVLGTGINAARALNDPHGFDVPIVPGTDFRLTTNQHSHNGYLQTWFDGGAIGAVFLLAAGLLLLRSLGSAPLPAQPYLYATFVASALMGASSFGLWQAWFMASLGFATVFAGLGWALAGRA